MSTCTCLPARTHGHPVAAQMLEGEVVPALAKLSWRILGSRGMVLQESQNSNCIALTVGRSAARTNTCKAKELGGALAAGRMRRTRQVCTLLLRQAGAVECSAGRGVAATYSHLQAGLFSTLPNSAVAAQGSGVFGAPGRPPIETGLHLAGRSCVALPRNFAAATAAGDSQAAAGEDTSTTAREVAGGDGEKPANSRDTAGVENVPGLDLETLPWLVGNTEEATSTHTAAAGRPFTDLNRRLGALLFEGRDHDDHGERMLELVRGSPSNVVLWRSSCS